MSLLKLADPHHLDHYPVLPTAAFTPGDVTVAGLGLDPADPSGDELGVMTLHAAVTGRTGRILQSDGALPSTCVGNDGDPWFLSGTDTLVGTSTATTASCGSGQKSRATYLATLWGWVVRTTSAPEPTSLTATIGARSLAVTGSVATPATSEAGGVEAEFAIAHDTDDYHDAFDVTLRTPDLSGLDLSSSRALFTLHPRWADGLARTVSSVTSVWGQTCESADETGLGAGGSFGDLGHASASDASLSTISAAVDLSAANSELHTYFGSDARLCAMTVTIVVARVGDVPAAPRVRIRGAAVGTQRKAMLDVSATRLEENSDVDIYVGDTCTGIPVRAGLAGDGTTSWMTEVRPNATTSFVAQRILRGMASACSSPARYTHDSTPPWLSPLPNIVVQTTLKRYVAPWQTPSANDATFGRTPVACSRSPHSAFAVTRAARAYTVACSSSDPLGNRVTSQFRITIGHPTKAASISRLSRKRLRITAGGFAPATNVVMTWGSRHIGTLRASRSGRIVLIYRPRHSARTALVTMRGVTPSGSTLLCVLRPHS